MVAAETRGHGQAGWRLVRTDEDRAIAGASVARPGYRAKLRDAGGGLHDRRL